MSQCWFSHPFPNPYTKTSIYHGRPCGLVQMDIIRRGFGATTTGYNPETRGSGQCFQNTRGSSTTTPSYCYSRLLVLHRWALWLTKRPYGMTIQCHQEYDIISTLFSSHTRWSGFHQHVYIHHRDIHTTAYDRRRPPRRAPPTRSREVGGQQRPLSFPQFCEKSLLLLLDCVHGTPHPIHAYPCTISNLRHTARFLCRPTGDDNRRKTNYTIHALIMIITALPPPASLKYGQTTARQSEPNYTKHR